MKLSLCILLLASAEAFVPSHHNKLSFATKRSTTARNLGIDPSSIQEHVNALQDAFSSFSLADAAAATSDAAVATAGDAATDAAGSGNGWFGFLTGPIEGLLKIVHNVFAAGLGSNSWGVSIIILTLMIKALTFPLTKQQLESTTKMQAMQPAIKEIQSKYQSNPEVMNQKVAEFYQANEINPLAGCIPSLVQIPIFIGLYRAVLTLAKEDALEEPFLFLPSLEGPTYGADPAHGSDWILKGWTDGVPTLGWDDTIAFLILPVLLVVSQFASMQLMQPKTDDPAQQAAQNNVVLKFLPFMIGWFSLNVPSALCVYWVTNNIVTTATSLYIRNSLQVAPVVTPSASSSSSSTKTAEPSIFSAPREKPSGFSAQKYNANDLKPITAMDAEVVSKSTTTSDSNDDIEDDVDDSEETSSSSSPSSSDEGSTKKRGGKKKRKKSNNKN